MSPRPLERYRSKRDFGGTPEPAGGEWDASEDDDQKTRTRRRGSGAPHESPAQARRAV
jgi:hypothetical protein